MTGADGDIKLCYIERSFAVADAVLLHCGNNSRRG
jgi:hypothetical protein